MLHGWIKLHRSILDNWVASEPESLAVWVRLLSEANHKETKKRFNGSLVTIGRGQVVFGLNAFSDKSGVSISKLRRILSELESDGMISRQITSKYSLITITCFDKYQDANSQIASESQADDNQTSSESQHRKNVNNGKNEKEDNKRTVSQSLDYSCWPSIPSEDVLKEWLSHRNRQKAKVTQLVVNRLASELQKASDKGHSVDDCLSECVVRGWRGFKAEWIGDKASSESSDSFSFVGDIRRGLL